MGNALRMRTHPAKWAWMVPVVVLLLLAVSTAAWANVYASGFVKTGDKSLTYILNENADINVQIQVWKVGGDMVYSEDLGPQTKGIHSWTWDGSGSESYSSYKVKVIASDDGYSAWTKISQDNMSTSFEYPVGVSVNKYDNTPNFGKIFVSNGRVASTVYGRSCDDGIYVLNADCSEVGFFTGGRTWTGDSAPWKSCIGPDGHLYVSDLANDFSFEFSEDMSTATQLTDATNITNYGQSNGQYVGGIYVSGTGADRKLFLLNTNYYDTSRKGLIRYDLGTNTRVPSGNTGTQWIARSYFTYYPYDVARDSEGNWYICQYRATAGQAPVMTKFRDVSESNPPPLDAADVIWEASNQYTYARGIDIYEPKQYIAYGHYADGKVRIFSMATGSFLTDFTAGSRIQELAFDAAGNIVTVDNITEWMRVWSPPDGPNSYASTTWFTFDTGYVEPHTLTLNVSPPGSGNVTGAGQYTPGQRVTVVATENAGYKLEKWVDGNGATVSTSESYTFLMPSTDLTLTAVFTTTTQRKLTLVGVPSQATGTLTGGGWYDIGATVSLSATPKDATWQFSKWTTDAAGTTNATTTPPQPAATCNYIMPSVPTTLYAQFVVASYDVTINPVPAAGGTPSVDGGATHQYNTSVTVNANPATDYFFLNWTDTAGAVKSRKPSYTFTMPAAPVTLNCNYVKGIFADGFEGLNLGSVDMNDGPGKPNLAANGDLTSGQPWWGTNPSNGSVGVISGLTAHSGAVCLYGAAGNGRDYVNLAYRYNSGSAYAENIYADWWFYDRSGTTWVLGGTAANYCDDPFSLVYTDKIETYQDWPTAYGYGTGQNFVDEDFLQKLSLGMCDWWTPNKAGTAGPYPEYEGFDHTKYQARIKAGSVPGQTSFGNGWYNVNLTRSVGWHHGRITLGPLNAQFQNDIAFYIDDMSTPLLTGSADCYGINAIELMTDWKNGPSGTAADTAVLNWPKPTMYDDIVIGPLPQPTPSAPGASAASGVTATSITWNWTQSGTVDGFDLFDAAVQGAQKGNAGGSSRSLTESSLTSNKVYSRWVSAYYLPAGPNAPFVRWQSSRTALEATCTLAAVPTSGTNVATTATVGGAYNSASWPGFTNPQGFGTDGKVSKFKYKWSQNPNDAIAEGQGTDWDSGTLSAPPPSDGTWYLYLRSYNQVGVGNGSTKLGEYIFDNQPPTGSIVINGGAETTTSLDVTLTLSSPDAAKMKFSNDGVTYTSPEPYATTKAWTLASGGGNLKTVYVKFIDAAGNESAAYSDTITYQSGTPVAKISDLWPLANGPAYILSDKVVTGVVGNAFWIEEEDRSAAIKVIYNGTMPAKDHKVTVTGVLDSSSGQRVLNASSVTDNGAATPIKPLFVVEKSAGGAGINANTPGITDGVGLYNIGMLVRIAGAAGNANTSDPNNKYFYLDDGSGLTDGAIPGIKVLCGTVTPPSSGNKTVTGLVGVVGGKPVIVIRGSGDIQ